MSNRGALHLHHVGYAAKNIDSIRDLYVNRYGYEICTQVIHDPLQTALVQFLRLSRATNPTWNSSRRMRPESALASATQRGGGLNHLCFTCSQLEPAIEHLETMQMKLISEPKLAVAFGGRRICWLVGLDRVPIELVERRDETDLCIPGLATADDVPVHSGSST